MKAEPNSSKVESSGQQEQKKEQRRGRPTGQGPKAAQTSPRARGKGSQGRPEIKSTFTSRKRPKKEKNAISLKGVAREAMKKASARALSLLEATRKVQKAASSRNQAQGAIKKVTQIPRRREKGQTGDSPDQRERGAAPGSQNREEPEGQDGSGSLEE